MTIFYVLDIERMHTGRIMVKKLIGLNFLHFYFNTTESFLIEKTMKHACFIK